MSRSARPVIALSALVLIALAGCQHSADTGASSALVGAPPAPRWPEQPIAVIDGVEQPSGPAQGDPRVIASILRQSRVDSRVMSTLKELTDAGPRLTGSSGLDRAENWAVDRFQSYGVTARREAWGEVATRFDRGPSRGTVFITKDPAPQRQPERTELENAAPPPLEWTEGRQMQLSWLSWSRGTAGPVRGRAIRLPQSEEEYARLKSEGKLKGAWVMLPSQRVAGQRAMRGRVQSYFESRAEAREKMAKGEWTLAQVPLRDRLAFDEVAGFISSSRDERVWTGGLRGWRERAADQIPPDVHAVVRQSDYDFVNSRLADGEQVELELDLQATITPGPFTQYNVVAEIPGSTRPGEVIIISGHLDSWDGPGSQGAIDNGTGSAVTLESARLLANAFRETGLRPARTIRFVLWGGEEQGLLGSARYVEQLKERGELDGVSVMLNDDGGTNWQGGITPADNMIDQLAAASSPVNNQFWSSTDQRWMNVNLKRGGAAIRTHGSSDHAPFNRAGVPGFFWDEVGRADYPFGWHTQNDKFDLAIPEYLVQSAANSAIIAYNMAMDGSLLARAQPAEIGPIRDMGPNLPAQRSQGGDFDSHGHDHDHDHDH